MNGGQELQGLRTSVVLTGLGLVWLTTGEKEASCGNERSSIVLISSIVRFPFTMPSERRSTEGPTIIRKNDRHRGGTQTPGNCSSSKTRRARFDRPHASSLLFEGPCQEGREGKSHAVKAPLYTDKNELKQNSAKRDCVVDADQGRPSAGGTLLGWIAFRTCRDPGIIARVPGRAASLACETYQHVATADCCKTIVVCLTDGELRP
jgi:hypothetical protein